MCWLLQLQCAYLGCRKVRLNALPCSAHQRIRNKQRRQELQAHALAHALTSAAAACVVSRATEEQRQASVHACMCACGWMFACVCARLYEEMDVCKYVNRHICTCKHEGMACVCVSGCVASADPVGLVLSSHQADPAAAVPFGCELPLPQRPCRPSRQANR